MRARSRSTVYPATIVGVPPQEDAYIAKATERIFLAPIRRAMLPEADDLWMPWQGVAHNIAVANIRTAYPGQGLKTASSLWGAGQMMFNKFLLVVSTPEAVGKLGYSRIGALTAASSAESLRSLRGKYPRVFFLVDGYDSPSANAKNCSYAFDRLGHGAVVCAGETITCAWKQAQSDGGDFLEQAVAAAERMKKNLTRYVTIL